MGPNLRAITPSSGQYSAQRPHRVQSSVKALPPCSWQMASMSMGQACAQIRHLPHLSCGRFARCNRPIFWNRAFQARSGQMRQKGWRKARPATRVKPSKVLATAPRANSRGEAVLIAVCSASAVSRVVAMREGQTWHQASPVLPGVSPIPAIRGKASTRVTSSSHFTGRPWQTGQRPDAGPAAPGAAPGGRPVPAGYPGDRSSRRRPC